MRASLWTGWLRWSSTLDDTLVSYWEIVTRVFKRKYKVVEQIIDFREQSFSIISNRLFTWKLFLHKNYFMELR